MEQEDYIKRQIDQLGYVLGKILNDLLGLKSRGQLSAGFGMADPVLKTGLNLNVDELISIPPEGFIQTLTGNRELNHDNLNAIAEILFLLSEEPPGPGKDSDRMKQLKKKALLIFEHIEETSSLYSYDRHLKIEKLKNAR